MGRLMSREVMQFANQGIPILTELANHYKVTTAQLKNMIEAGQVSAKDTEEALKLSHGMATPTRWALRHLRVN